MSRSVISLAHGSHTIAVQCPGPEDVQWLRENLVPAFSEVHRRDADLAIECLVDLFLFRSLCGEAVPESGPIVRVATGSSSHKSPCFSFDNSVAEYPALNGDPCCVLDSDLGFIYCHDPAANLTRVVARRSHNSIRIALLRLIREIAGRAFMDAGALQFHAAALDFEGHGLLICGPKRAGKTSLLTYFLSSGAARYLSNDRSLVEPLADGCFRLSGIPTVVSVRAGLTTLMDVPRGWNEEGWLARETLAQSGVELRKRGNAGGRSPASLSPAQYCRLLECTAAADSPLRTLLFPRVDSEVQGIEVRRLRRAEARTRLLQSMMPRRRTIFVPEAGSGEERITERRLAENLTEACVAYELALGRNAYANDGANVRLMQRLVG